MKMFRLILAAAAYAQSTRACDFCSVYSATEAQAGQGVFAGIAEQFTHFGTLQDRGHEVPNETGQFLESSISQVFAGYNVNRRFGIQLNAPLIYRSFKRPEGFAIDRGGESGLSDISLIGKGLVYRQMTESKTLLWNVLGGVKFPTGDTRRLKEEFNETEIPGAPENGIHGHDLTLGSGSFDGVVGTSVYARYKRAFLSAGAQYSIRSKGDFGYRFANDLTWTGGPGAVLVLNESFTLSLQANVSGETKGRDTFRGERAVDTGITTFYAGPELTATWSEKFTAEIGVDVPVSIDNTALQVVPDYRIHAALTWHF